VTGLSSYTASAAIRLHRATVAEVEAWVARRVLATILLVILVSTLAFLLGPRVAVDTRVTFDPTAIGADPEVYLASREAGVPGIRQGLAKEIVWADPVNRARTPVAIVYVHGFSASKGEVRPLPDLVAKALGANLFYTRLSGHAQDSAAMGTASVNDWINDYAEATAIGHAIGDKVVVIATSTGASLAVQAAAAGGREADVAAMALISPNFAVNSTAAVMLNWPWGRQIAHLLVGETRSFPPRNAAQAALWTTSYPTDALLPMAALTKLALKAPVEQAKVPALFIFSDSDTVVRANLTRQVAARWGAPHELVPVENSGDRDNHVIAGDALSPATTAPLAEKIVAWLRTVLPPGH